MLALYAVFSSCTQISAAVRPFSASVSASRTDSRCVMEMRLLSTTHTRPLYSAASAFAVSQEPLSAEDIGMCTTESCVASASSHIAVRDSGEG